MEETSALGHAEKLGEQPHKTATQILMRDIANPRGGKPLGISCYYDPIIITPEDNIGMKLRQMREAAQDYFDGKTGKQVSAAQQMAL